MNNLYNLFLGRNGGGGGRIRQHLELMPFVENTGILRRDEQVLDHILTMEIKTHFILNFIQSPTVIISPSIVYADLGASACATSPPKTVGINGERVILI